MQAGFDVYSEKPLSLTLNQGQHCAGRWKRANFPDRQPAALDDRSCKTCEYIRNGRQFPECRVIGGAPQTEAVPDEPVPPGLAGIWLGWQNVYPITRCPYVTFAGSLNIPANGHDWGASSDIMQWALPDGPVLVRCRGGQTWVLQYIYQF